MTNYLYPQRYKENERIPLTNAIHQLIITYNISSYINLVFPL